MSQQQFKQHLTYLEQELRHLSWWQDDAPNADALQSTEPFCVDTLNFSQWLQWIYLPKMRAYLEINPYPPKPSYLLPMAEEAWRGLEEETKNLRLIIETLDNISNQ